MATLARALRLELRRDLTVAADVTPPPRGPRLRVLCVGWLDAGRRRALQRLGVEIVSEPFTDDALMTARTAKFDRIVIDPDCAGAMPFVHELKRNDSPQRNTPVFVMPVSGENEYAIIVAPPHLVWIQSEERLPLTDAIARLDFAAPLRARQ